MLPGRHRRAAFMHPVAVVPAAHVLAALAKTCLQRAQTAPAARA